MSRFTGFGRRSQRELSTCREPLQRVALEASRSSPLDWSVLSGRRTLAEQTKLIELGVSRISDPLLSKHVPSFKNGEGEIYYDNSGLSSAFDLAPYFADAPHYRWKDTGSFYVLAGTILSAASRVGVILRWGGDWDGDGETADQSFNDLGHFELVD